MQPGLVSPVFVGRGEELDGLMEALESAGVGEPAVVVVGGEAGVGKTRLVEEAAMRALDSGARVLTGSCIELGGRGLPLSPVADALRSLIRTMDPDELDELIGPARPELARLLPELGSGDAASLPPPAEEGSTRLLEMVFGLIGRLAADQPLMVVIEDLHWADQSTLDLVSLLVRALRGVPVLLVLTFRSDEMHRAHPLWPLISGWERVRSVRRMELPRFNQDEAAGQLEAILGSPPPKSTFDTVYDRSEGNPFLIEEILGALQAGAAANDLPMTLRDVLLARAERLSAPTLSVLRVAAAAGRSVPDMLLAVVSGGDEASLDLALREAVEHHLLVVDETDRGYRFRHALTRDAIYSDMLPRERVRIHAAYAQALSADPALAGPDASLAAQLALHWSAAHDLPRAVGACVEAARQEAAYAPSEALRHLEQALELWPSVQDAEQRAGMDIVEVLRLAAASAYAAGDLERSLALYDEALDELRSGDEERIALILAAKSAALDDLGRDADATAVAERAVSLLASEPPTVARAVVLVSLAGRRIMDVDMRGCRDAAAEAVAAARAVGAPEQEAAAMIILGSSSAYLGDIEDGEAELRRGLELAESLGDYALALRGYLNLSDILQMEGDHQQAADVATAGLALARRVGLTRHVYGGYLIANLSEALIHLGRWSEAEAVINDGIRSDIAGVLGIALIIHRARIAALSGRFEDAERDLHGRGPGPVQFALPTEFVHALAELGTGRFGEARARIERAFADGPEESLERYEWPLVWLGLRVEAESGEPRAERVSALRAHGEALPARSAQTRAYRAFAAVEAARASGADARWVDAVGPARDSRDPYLLAYALVHAASDAVLAGDRDGAQEPLTEATRIAAEIGAGSLLTEAQALARRARLRVADVGPAAASAEPGLDSFGLTEREREVLELVAAGRSIPQIAAELFISPKTASVHVSNIISKLNVTSRGEAAAVAHRLGAAEPAP
ncbi:MAG TPA: AAA family ATPase [Solirubrobacteraceae bacterium]|nr:AAA family ATPase [Solirubrobacteraceae bacterium]